MQSNRRRVTQDSDSESDVLGLTVLLYKILVNEFILKNRIGLVGAEECKRSNPDVLSRDFSTSGGKCCTKAECP